MCFFIVIIGNAIFNKHTLLQYRYFSAIIPICILLESLGFYKVWLGVKSINSKIKMDNLILIALSFFIVFGTSSLNDITINETDKNN